jgi:hypothetical protein
MTQDETNQSWKQTLTGNGITVEVLQPPYQKRKGLRYPYTRTSTTKKVLAFKAKMKEMSKFYQDVKLQCFHTPVERKTYGWKVSVFMLGYKPGLCGSPEGILKEEWEKLAKDFTVLLSKLTGEPESVYMEPWSDESKFQIRWEKYLQVDF